MYIGIEHYDGQVGPIALRMRCPACRHNARLEPLNAQVDQKVVLKDGTEAVVALRHCPDEDCAQIIFVVAEYNGAGWEVLFAAPNQALDLDTTNLPAPVRSSMQEAASCFGNGAYVASAIMIRKTLEEVCHDRKATGSNLKERLQSLGSLVILPQALLTGLDSLRLLGNDAAHIESQTFSSVGRDEVSLSFDVVKEVLKAVYQYDDLIARLEAMKK